MRARLPIVLSVAVVFCSVIVWKVVRSRSTTPVREAASHLRDADAPKSISADAAGESTDANARGSEGKVGGIDRASYDAITRTTWRLLRRGDAGQLVRELAHGKSIDDIRDDDLRRLVSAKLRETDDEYARLKQARLTSEEAVIQKKIAAAMYVPENPQAPESWTSNEHSNRKILMSTWRKLPDATMTRVDVFEGEAPEFEESRREFHLIEERRVKEVTRIFEDHGLVITWPSK